MLRNRLVMVMAGAALLLAAATSANAQHRTSLGAAGNGVGRHVGVQTASTTRTASARRTTLPGSRSAKPASTTKQRKGDDQGENDQECSSTTRGTVERDSDEQGENEQGEACPTTTKSEGDHEKEHESTTTKHESDDSGDHQSGGDSGDHQGDSGGGGDD